MLDFDSFSKSASDIESNFMVKYSVYEKLRNDGTRSEDRIQIRNTLSGL